MVCRIEDVLEQSAEENFGWREQHNEEVHNLHSSTVIIRSEHWRYCTHVGNMKFLQNFCLKN
jgi:hypothetical protein